MNAKWGSMVMKIVEIRYVRTVILSVLNVMVLVKINARNVQMVISFPLQHALNVIPNVVNAPDLQMSNAPNVKPDLSLSTQIHVQTHVPKANIEAIVNA